MGQDGQVGKPPPERDFCAFSRVSWQGRAEGRVSYCNGFCGNPFASETVVQAEALPLASSFTFALSASQSFGAQVTGRSGKDLPLPLIAGCERGQMGSTNLTGLGTLDVRLITAVCLNPPREKGRPATAPSHSAVTRARASCCSQMCEGLVGVADREALCACIFLQPGQRLDTVK